MSEELKKQIHKEIADSTVHIFMKGTPEWPQCGFSKAACDAFRSLDAPFSTTNVLEDLDSYRAALQEVSNWPTIPQIFIDGEFIGGCDIILQMLDSGELQEKLEALTGKEV
ncbi:MAG: Grx4 family monothiol glutaredoxin [Acidobacteriota bacterium]